MKSRRSNVIVSTVGVLGLAVLVAAGATFQRPLLERWYLWRLDSKNEAERKVGAQKLGEIGSLKAIPRLLEIFRQEGRYQVLHWSGQALSDIGPEAVRALKEECQNGPPGDYGSIGNDTLY